MRSRSVSNDSSGTAFLTPIPGGTSKVFNSGASYATGGMFRSLSNIPRIPIDPLVINKWLLDPPSPAIDEATAPTSRASNSEMQLLMIENSSLLLRLQAVEKENNYYRNQAPEKVPQLITSVDSLQKPVMSDVSSQTDIETSAKCLEDNKALEDNNALDMLNLQVDGLQQKLRESQKKNELLEHKLNASMLQQKKSVELREEEKKKHAEDLSKQCESLQTLKQEVHELRSLNRPVKAVPLPAPRNQQNNIEKVKLLLEKFRGDHNNDKNMLAAVVTKFGESLRASEEEMLKVIKTEIQNKELKFKKMLITKEDEIANLSLKVKELDGQLTCANERRDITTSDVGSLSERLALACTCLQEVTAKHVLVVQSLTHDAHVRDLARIAALRESALDRDRVTNDLEFCRLVSCKNLY